MKPLKVFSIEQFRAAAKEAGAETFEDAVIRVGLDTEVKVSEDDSRTINFAISSENVDRMGDTIALDGWELDAYAKNPVVLWAHDSSMLPVGRSQKVWKEAKRLKSIAEFTPLGMVPFNDTVYEMYKGGFLNATSVGFMPLKYAFSSDPARGFGIDFIKQELMEYSCCPVPANADALVEGRSAGIDVEPLLGWCEDQIIQVCLDKAHIKKLVDSILGSSTSGELLAWAEAMAAKTGMVVVSKERMEAIERAAAAARIARKNAQRQRDLDLIRVKG